MHYILPKSFFLYFNVHILHHYMYVVKKKSEENKMLENFNKLAVTELKIIKI